MDFLVEHYDRDTSKLTLRPLAVILSRDEQGGLQVRNGMPRDTVSIEGSATIDMLFGDDVVKALRTGKVLWLEHNRGPWRWRKGEGENWLQDAQECGAINAELGDQDSDKNKALSSNRCGNEVTSAE